MPLTPRSAGSYLLFGFCLEKCISTGHSSTRTKRKRGEEMRLIEHIKRLKKQNPNAFGEFLFGVTIAMLNLFQIVGIVLLCFFR